MQTRSYDVVIIGGGIMGLCTAYYASQFTDRVVLLEKSTLGIDNKQAASFSLTRSIRNDYLDPFYALLAYEARQLWLDLQRSSSEQFLIECGCLNLASRHVSPEFAATYAEQSYQTLHALHLRTAAFTREALQERFPQFVADIARLDVEAGFLYVPQVTQILLRILDERGVRIIEGIDVQRIEQRQDLLAIRSEMEVFTAPALVITAGWGTNELLRRIDGCALQFPLTPDRPSQSKYFLPPSHKREQFTSDALPVFAYLDVGIYGHPIYEGRTPGVKIGFYNPPDVQTRHTSIHDVHSFVRECMPSLLDAETVDVTDVDQCYYDLVEDDNFILGRLPGFSNIQVGVGWRGTGYKYAPLIGRALMQLALQGGTVYDIARFTPQRFVKTGA